MEKINIDELDRLISAYFGQDCYMIDDSGRIEPLIDVYIAESPKGIRNALIADIDLFLTECDSIDSDFQDRYESRFSPELWGTTPANFQKTGQRQNQPIHQLNPAAAQPPGASSHQSLR